MEFIKCILLAAILALPVAFGTHARAETTADVFYGGTVTSPVGNGFKTPKTLAPSMARVTFYRPPVGYVAGATGIEINGRYHTSLQPASYTEVCMTAPASTSVSLRLMETGQAIKNYVDTTQTLALRPAQEAYVRVTDVGNGSATLGVVTLTTAQKELRSTNRQIHAVSRVPGAVSCNPQAKPVATTSLETITLGSDALFGFGKSNIASIVPYGRQELDKLITRLQNRYGDFENIQVEIVGHADPLGSYESNQRLSTERAQTIQDYMINAGIDSTKISSEGRGATQPVVTNCPRVATPESIACNKLNRRVVVAVSVITR
jgi:OOP family OmpA-OmpF porin